MHGRGHWLVAAVYDRLTASAERGWLGERRAGLIEGATGRVLEVGAGTGANLRHLRGERELVVVEPDPAMRKRLVARAADASPRPSVVDAVAEALPFEDGSFDTVVFTLALCSVADVDRSLGEARRVLTSGGRLLLLEHVRGVGRHGRWQDRITPVWSRFAAGCHPNRDIADAVERVGFRFERHDTFEPMPAWVPTSPMVEIVARPQRRRTTSVGSVS